MTEHLLLSLPGALIGAYALTLTQVLIRWRRSRGKIDTNDGLRCDNGNGEIYMLYIFFPVPDNGFSFPPYQATTTMPGVSSALIGAYALTQVVIRWRRNRGKIDATTAWVPPDGGGEINMVLSDFLHYFFPVPDDGFSFQPCQATTMSVGALWTYRLSSAVRRPP